MIHDGVGGFGPQQQGRAPHYAKRAQVLLPTLEDYEQRAAEKVEAAV